jgi:hypothetical protein
MRFKLIILFFIFSTATAPAWAEDLAQQISQLKPLPVKYGAAELNVAGRKILITRAEYRNDGPWGGDVYSVMVKDGESWQLARHSEENKLQSAVFQSLPHTYEDSLTSIRFMMPKTGNPVLYVLESKRKFQTPPTNPSTTSFTLYVLENTPDDFNILYFRKIGTKDSKRPHCNADWAAFKELGVPLPNDGNNYECGG